MDQKSNAKVPNGQIDRVNLGHGLRWCLRRNVLLKNIRCWWRFWLSFLTLTSSTNFHNMSLTSKGDSDVSDLMMVTDLRFWWQNHYVGDLFLMLLTFTMLKIGRQHLKSVTIIWNLSPTESVSNFRHQHRCSLISI